MPILQHLQKLHQYALQILQEQELLMKAAQTPDVKLLIDRNAKQYALTVQQLVISIHQAAKDVTVFPIILKQKSNNDETRKG